MAYAFSFRSEWALRVCRLLCLGMADGCRIPFFQDPRPPGPSRRTLVPQKAACARWSSEEDHGLEIFSLLDVPSRRFLLCLLLLAWRRREGAFSLERDGDFRGSFDAARQHYDCGSLATLPAHGRRQPEGLGGGSTAPGSAQGRNGRLRSHG